LPDRRDRGEHGAIARLLRAGQAGGKPHEVRDERGGSPLLRPGGVRKEEVALAVHEHRAAFLFRLRSKLLKDRLPGEQSFDDSDPLFVFVFDRQGEDGNRTELADEERLAQVNRAIASRLEALAELELDLGQMEVGTREAALPAE